LGDFLSSGACAGADFGSPGGIYGVFPGAGNDALMGLFDVPAGIEKSIVPNDQYYKGESNQDFLYNRFYCNSVIAASKSRNRGTRRQKSIFSSRPGRKHI
jgi:hypothetical protein